MMQKILYLLAIVASLFVVALPSVAAADVFGPVCDQSDATDSAVCIDKTDSADPADNPIAGPDGLLYKITLIISFIAGAAAVILVIYGGIRYVTSGGDSQSITNAKNTIVNAVIGLIIISLAGALIAFFVKRL